MKKSYRLAALAFSALLLAGCSSGTSDTKSPDSPTISTGSQTTVSEGSASGSSTPSGDNTTPATPASYPLPTPTSLLPKQPVRLTACELEYKKKGGWIGQMVGVAWGASTEFCYRGTMIPESKVPAWSPEMINSAFDQDDLYVEIPFIETMIKKGAFCKPEDIATAFRKTTFAAWHANGRARENLRNGIGYPDSGSYLYNYHCDDIDWQIECDFLGQIYPGLVNEAAARAFELGHIMNYGDGVYGGVFVTALHSAAFTAESVEELCRTGTEIIPEGTKFRMLLEDVWASYRAGDSFALCWQKIENKWGNDDRCPELCGHGNIDAKLNSGYVLMGLLYGKGDFKDSTILSMRCGQDSDCNPSTVAAILGNFCGAEKLEDVYKSALKETGRFVTTRYTFKKTIEDNCKLAEEVLAEYGAEKNEDGWVYTVEKELKEVPYEQWEKGLYAEFSVKTNPNGSVSASLFTYGTPHEVVKTSFDMGDGRVLDSVPAEYFYEKPGTYTVKLTAVDSEGEKVELSREVAVSVGKASTQTIICSVTAPTGGGSKNIGVICDGVVPNASSANDSMQYDTFIYTEENYRRSVYIGYVYKQEKQISTVSFTEGNHFGNGGWFADGTLSVEVLKDGVWQKAEATVSPAYPNGNALSSFGKGYETYVFTLKTPGFFSGVRLIGIAGGGVRGGFISCSELAVS